MKTIFTFAIAMALLPTVGYSDQDYDDAPSITKRLPNATQGPLWPPSELVDKDGNFVVVGTGLIETAPGVVAPMPNQALLVSKNTVPPLNSAGKEDFSNPIGAPYKVIRPLNLSPGSADLKKELYTVSFGPFSGDFGGGQRIPAASDSLYNLNMARPSCLEVFPTESQKFTFTRPSFPLSKAPVNGFQGDQIAYDIDTGKPYDPMTTSGPGCGDGCPGENNADQRSTSPITLGDWLKADGKVKITLTQYNGHLKAYTAARFDLDFKKLRPNSVYTVWAVRKNAMLPRPDERLPTPLGVPNTFTSDNNGNGHLTVNLKNPFPDPATDDKGLRIMVLAVVYHSDYQNWGACPAHFGPGVDVHQAFNSSADGTMDITNFMTKEAP
ncbi:MAG: hypothetical protein ACOYMG_08815 [Candidatus Methylumidiphilus sp.]